MKTLDEVIKAFEWCKNDKCYECAYYEKVHADSCITKRDGDALQYLKAYKDDRNDLTALRAYWKEQQENKPLTWDELKTMEGKPVWVELPKSNRRAWGLNDGIFVDSFFNEIITIKVLHDLWHLSKVEIVKTWQAYRKERS